MGLRIRSNQSGSRQAGAGCLIPFGLFFGGMGLVFFVFLFREFLAEAETYRWEETPCEIVHCEIAIDAADRDDPFRLDVEFRYRYEGRQRVSDDFKRKEKRSDEYEKLALIRRELLRDPQSTCYVNPAMPDEAVLRREALAAGLFCLFPLIFVAVGAGIVWAGIVSLRKKREEKAGKAAISSSGSSSSKAGWMVGIAFGGIFALVGLGVGLGMFLGPIQRMFDSGSWEETPCEVIWSRVLSHSSDDGTTYSVDIFYEYEFRGVTHRSNRYGAMSGSSSGRSGKQAIVDRYPKGSRQVCYVNPDLPEQAMLNPGWSAWGFFVLLPLLFAVIGLVVIVASLRSRSKQEATSPAGLASLSAGASNGRPSRSRSSASPAGIFSGHVPASDQDGGPVVLKPHASRWVKLGGILFFALFWNGIVSVFLVEVVKGWSSGNGDIFLTLFLIPFLLVGLGVMVAFLYQLLAMANPKPVITLETGHPRLGEPMTLSWSVSGPASRVVRFRVTLWGIESATYRRGTDTVTSSEVFYEQVIADTSALSEVENGRATVEIPGDLMHSLKLGNNQVKYELRVKGDIPLWPDIGDSFDLTVLPRHRDPV